MYCTFNTLYYVIILSYKDADPIISEETEKKFLAIARYNVTEGGTPRIAQKSFML